MLELIVLVSITCGVSCPYIQVRDYSSLTACEIKKASMISKPSWGDSDIAFCTVIKHEIQEQDMRK